MMQLRFHIRYILISLFLLFSLAVGAKDKSFVLVLDPGHGGKDTGAVGALLKEKDVNLSVAKMLGDYITANHKDVKIIYTRSTDVFIPLIDRADIANKAKADLFISIHANAAKSKQPYGTETFTLGLSSSEENLEVAKRENSVITLEDDYKQTYEGFDPSSSESYIIFEFMQNKYMSQSIAFASKIQNQFSGSAKRTDRGVKQAEFLVLRQTSMPSVLIEMGFLSNREEEKYLKSNDGKKDISRCVYNAFREFKHEHDRKLGVLTFNTSDPVSDPHSNLKNEDVETETTQTQVQKSNDSGKTIYKVQILASDKKLSEKSSLLKGYKNTTYYVENGLYKYTYGESSDWSEISKVRKSLLKDFKDAFIISFKNGQKVQNK